MADYASGSHDAVFSQSHSGENDRIGPDPHILFYCDRFRTDSLFVNPLLRIQIIMVESRHSYILRQIHVVADMDRAYNRIP